MAHDEMVNLLGAYVDEELTPRQRHELEAHLKQCPDCRRQVDETRRVSSRLQEWPAMARQKKQERAFCQQVMERLPARRAQVVRKRDSQPPKSFLFPAGVVLTSAFVQSAALVALILSVLAASGALGELSVQIEQSLSTLIQSPGSTVAQYTWIGQIVYRLLNQGGIGGAQASEWGATALSVIVPAIFFLVLALMIFLALSGWAGWHLSRNRVHA